VREQLIDFLQTTYPTALPHTRTETLLLDQAATGDGARDARPPRTAAR